MDGLVFVVDFFILKSKYCEFNIIKIATGFEGERMLRIMVEKGIMNIIGN